MGNPLISVIIPVYNVGKYVRKCAMSAMGQTYKNLDIILADDGSTDGGGTICDELARADERIRVYHTANAGVAAARNLGIKEAKGEYIAFIDGDDYVTADYIARLYSLLRERRADISITNYLIQYDGAEAPGGKKITPYTLVMDGYEALEMLLYAKYFDTGMWGKLFSRSLFEGLAFARQSYEDFEILYKLLDKAKRVVYNSAADYVYFQRLGSIMHPLTKEDADKCIEDCFAVTEEMALYITSKYRELAPAVVYRRFTSNFGCLKEIRFRDIYRGEYAQIRAGIRKHRKSVLMNPKTSFTIKIIAALSYLGIGFLKTAYMLHIYLKARKYRRTTGT